MKLIKNEIAQPFHQSEFQILYGQSINRRSEILELGVHQGIVDKSGAWYAYKGDKIGQGKKNAVAYLTERPQVANEIETQLRDLLLAKPGKRGDDKAGSEQAVALEE